MSKSDDKTDKSFWQTVPGIITAFAALITAIGGCIAVVFGIPAISNAVFGVTPTPIISQTAFSVVENTSTFTQMPTAISPTVPPTTVPPTEVPPAVPTPTPLPVCERYNTVPLKLYFQFQLLDNFTTATRAGEDDAVREGFQFIRTEGRVFTEPLNGTVPLKLYFNRAQNDNFTIAGLAPI